MMSMITIELPPHSDLLGFAFSLVLSLELCIPSSIWIECKCYLEDDEIVTNNSQEYHWLDGGKGLLITDYAIL